MTTLTATIAAQQAGVSIATIRTWCRRGAVAATKTAGRWVIEAASLARRIALGIRKPAKLVAFTIDTITAIGGSRWTKGGKDRIYINGWTKYLGLEIEHYRSGNISSATLNGESISNSEAYRLASAVYKVYFDVTDGKVYIQWGNSDPRTMTRDEIAEAIFSGIRAAIAAL
ncbi:helix-turn-helix domain-containing protein [Microbispora rosea]|uniref:helix-turn-helix domain-containing protein n=1 Tax=Microbispora rosea TaxID=58117 RepID=UPI0004C44073|nr:helix-turn-helix domain-containing protein [Microbispora rosea]